MATPVNWLPDFKVNTGAADILDIDRPSIIGLSNGNILVAWGEGDPTGFPSEAGTGIGSAPGRDIIGKLFDAEGNVVRDSFVLNTLSTEDDESDFDIAPTSDGGFQMVYAENETATQSDINWERYNANGDSIDRRIVASEDENGSLSNPQIAVNNTEVGGGNRAYITWTDSTGGEEFIKGAYILGTGALFNGPNGTIWDAAQNQPGEFNRGGESAILTNGNVVTVYEEEDGGTAAGEIYIADTNGNQVANVNLATGASFDPQIASLSNGNFVVAYSVADESGNIEFQIFNSTGGSVGGPFAPANGANFQNEPDVIALPDGGFVIAWDDDSARSLLARTFFADGSFDGATIAVADPSDGTEIDVGVTGDGRILFAWDGLNGDIRASIWDPRDSSAIDSADYASVPLNFVNADVVTAGPGSSTIVGDAGSDTLIGSDSDDSIDAGDGADRIIGGRGGNSIDGGDDADVILGDDAPVGLLRLNEGSVVDQYAEATTFDAMPTDAFTVEWLFQSFGPQDNDASFVSYATSTAANNEFLVFGASGGQISVFVNGNQTFTGVNTATVFDDGAVHRMSVSVDTADGPNGRISLYIDGVEVFSGPGAVAGVGAPIEAGGTFIVGQDQDSLGGGFQTTQALQGSVGDIRVWSTERTQTDIDDTKFTQFDSADLSGNPSLVANWQVDPDSGVFSALTGTQTLDRVSAGSNPFTADSSDIGDNGGNDTIAGGAGPDTIFGGSGNDTIEGGAGADDMDGGGGTNTLSYATSANGVWVDLSINDARDNNSGPSDAAGDTIANFQDVIGSSSDDTLIDGVGDNSIEGGAGSDSIVARYGGTDTLRGGSGNDVISLVPFVNTVGEIYDGGANTDTFRVALNTDPAFSTVDLSDDTVIGFETLSILDFNPSVDERLQFTDAQIAQFDTIDYDDVVGDGMTIAVTMQGTSLDLSGTTIAASVPFHFEITGTGTADSITGSTIDNSIRGGGGADTIEGGDNDDSLFGDAGVDSILGGDGDDYIEGGTTFDDTLRGGDGDDTIEAVGGGLIKGNADNDTFIVLDNNVIGDTDTADSDLFDGGDGIDVFDASNELNQAYTIDLLAQTVDREGNGVRTVALVNFENATGSQLADSITGDTNANELKGEGGNDTIDGLGGNDSLLGGGDNDLLLGGFGFDTLEGGTGNDTLDGQGNADILLGGAGDDSLIGGDGTDRLEGGDNNDRLFSGAGADRVFGGDGNDLIRAGTNFGASVDGVEGGAGNDTIFGEGGFDLLIGGIGDDYIDGGAQADDLRGESGNDTLIGGAGFDRLFGGEDDDLLQDFDGFGGQFGGTGNDTLQAGDDPTRFFGGQGNDLIEAGGGNDTIGANAGFDTIDGGTGDDLMFGDFNADTFVFADGHGADTIADFDALNALEKIDLSAVSAITSLADLGLGSATTGAATQVGANVLISTGGGNTIELQGVALSDLDAGDFVL